MVSLSVGGLMGGAFLHLLPEASEKVNGENIFLFTLIGFFLFLIIEKIIHWRHCHKDVCPIHTFVYMNLMGDAIHNFIDGIIIAASFIFNPSVGFASTVAIFLHEIPQEIGDFGVLVYGGIDKRRALFLNFLTAITSVVGGVLGFYFLGAVQNISQYLLSIAAGGFIYIAATDLIPEIRKENDPKKSIINFGIIFLGIMLMYILKTLE